MAITGDLIAHTKPKEATISAVITRSDGSREDLGTVAYYHRNPLLQWWWNIRHPGQNKR